MTNKDTIAVASETGESPFAVHLMVGRHVLVGDEPDDAGGRDKGPSPYQLLTASLAECTAMTVRWFARQRQWPLEHVSVEVIHTRPEGSSSLGRADTFTKVVTIRGDDLTKEQRRSLLEIASKCPVQRTLQAGATVITLAESAL